MYKKVNIPVLNLYAESNEFSEVVSQALYGWTVKIIDEKNLYQKIQTGDQYEGWVPSHCLLDQPESQNLKRAKIIHNAAHVYSVPDTTKQKPLLTLPFEVELPVVEEPAEENFRWIQVQLADNQLAWIQRGNVFINPPLLSLEEVMKLSQQFLGLPYTWGGTSSFGYDCSGFTQMLYRQMGILLPRDAYLQAKESICQKIPLEEVKAGDLIFFGRVSDKITHVGFYLGESKFIHASVKPVPILQVTEIDDPELEKRLTFRVAGKVKAKDQIAI